MEKEERRASQAGPMIIVITVKGHCEAGWFHLSRGPESSV